MEVLKIIIVIIITGGSTFELPDLSPYFPHLSAEESKITEEEFSYLLFNLNRHTSKVKEAFAGIIFDLQKEIEKNSTLQTVITCLIAYDKSYESLLGSASLSEVFNRILKHSSFFDYKIFKLLIRKVGSTKTRIRLKKYEAMFKEYSKRRVVECPSDAFGDVEKSEKVYVLKTDKILESLTTAELTDLCHEMNAILNLNLLRLLKVEEGCVQLTFRGLEDDKFNTTKDQQQALRNLGVLTITYGDQIIVDNKYLKPTIMSECSCKLLLLFMWQAY